MTDLVITLPNKTTPGYLKRQRRALEFRSKMMSKDPDALTVEDFDGLVRFLSQFVTTPADPEQAYQTLYDQATEEQFDALLNSLLGGDANPTPSPQKRRKT